MTGPIERLRQGREPVVFIRIFMATTGMVIVTSGVFVAVLTIWRLGHPLPALLPVPRAMIAVFTFAFLLSFLLSGVCWVLVAMSRRLWNSTS